MYNELSTPAVIVDLDIAERNIARMAERLRAKGIAHRPHIKTTKSAYFVRKQLAAGAAGITVAKLAEAETFVQLGIDNILVAYPIVGEDKLRRLEALRSKASIVVTVDSMEAAEGLSGVGMRSKQPVDVLIEVDGGLHRGGRQPGADTVDFARAISALPGIRLKGIMGYFGTIYRNKDEEGFRKAAQHESQVLRETASLLRAAGFCADIVSAGSFAVGPHVQLFGRGDGSSGWQLHFFRRVRGFHGARRRGRLRAARHRDGCQRAAAG
ncbi:alanine racemase [Gordoniibacillus kamchatkensis]|uniref:alanine racemase n=1 Tax=Gordoniibacillus kamchatkensis TaxID=1590651 RepID=UPI000A4B3831|nr:alanine racemase [Paenibacillus sp. VKM B-2647]